MKGTRFGQDRDLIGKKKERGLTQDYVKRGVNLVESLKIVKPIFTISELLRVKEIYENKLY